MAHSSSLPLSLSLRIEPLGASSPQYFHSRVPVDQFTTLGLRKTRGDVGGYFLALPEHPVFKIELLANDLESLIEDFAGVPIRARLDGQVEHTLLFGFQVNRHGRFLAALTMLNCSDLLVVVKHEKRLKNTSELSLRKPDQRIASRRNLPDC
jgi:hypothetical protein